MAVGTSDGRSRKQVACPLVARTSSAPSRLVLAITLLPPPCLLSQDAIKIRAAIRSALEATSSALAAAKELVSTETEPQPAAAAPGTGVAGR